VHRHIFFRWPTQVHIPSGISIGSAVFAQLTAERPYTLQWAAHSSPSKLPLPVGYTSPHLIHDSLGPPESATRTASQSVQPSLQDTIMTVTGRQTDRLRCSVCNNRSHLRSTAMRPNNGTRDERSQSTGQSLKPWFHVKIKLFLRNFSVLF